MEKFNLDKALAGKQVKTKIGAKILNITVIESDNLKYPVACEVEGFSSVIAYSKDGKHSNSVLVANDYPLDLVMAEESYYGFKEDEDCYVLCTGGGYSGYPFKSDKDYLINCLHQGNVFKTKKEAEKECDYRAAKFRLNAKMRELEGDWKADWDDEEQQKFFFCFDNRRAYCGLETTYNCSRKYTEDWRYSNEETIKWVIENMAEEIKTVLGVE